MQKNLHLHLDEIIFHRSSNEKTFATIRRKDYCKSSLFMKGYVLVNTKDIQNQLKYKHFFINLIYYPLNKYNQLQHHFRQMQIILPNITKSNLDTFCNKHVILTMVIQMNIDKSYMYVTKHGFMAVKQCCYKRNYNCKLSIDEDKNIKWCTSNKERCIPYHRIKNIYYKDNYLRIITNTVKTFYIYKENEKLALYICNKIKQNNNFILFDLVNFIKSN